MLAVNTAIITTAIVRFLIQFVKFHHSLHPELEKPCLFGFLRESFHPVVQSNPFRTDCPRLTLLSPKIEYAYKASFPPFASIIATLRVHVYNRNRRDFNFSPNCLEKYQFSQRRSPPCAGNLRVAMLRASLWLDPILQVESRQAASPGGKSPRRAACPFLPPTRKDRC